MPCQTRLACACHDSVAGFGSNHVNCQTVFQAGLNTCLNWAIAVHIVAPVVAMLLVQLFVTNAQPVPTEPENDSWSPLAIPGVLMVDLPVTPHTQPVGLLPLPANGICTMPTPADKPQLPHFGAAVMFPTISGA